MNDTLPWTKKYLPRSSQEIIGQEGSVLKAKRFIAQFPKTRKKALLLHGPVGCGKTSLAHVMAKEFDLEILEVNSSDYRTKKKIDEIILPAVSQMSLFGRKKLILIDEIDGISGRDRGGTSAVVSVIAKSAFPIILTANNPYDKKFSTLRKKCELVEMNELSYKDVFIVLKRICNSESITYDEDTLKSLSRRAGGDLRGAITDLQILAGSTRSLERDSLDELSVRMQTESMLQALVKIFKTRDPNIAKSAFNTVNEPLDRCFLWVDENLPREYETAHDIAAGYDALSKADVFFGRIRRRQVWRFLVYANIMMTAGVALAKQEKYKKFITYKPTERILKLWIAKQKYLKRKAIAAKLAKATHCSVSYTVQRTIPLFKNIFKNDKRMSEAISSELDLDDDEVSWLSS